ncbi:hypothetical protein L7F22_043041 [Adiantum nelumboides]|nr:hypothetical protein [Adiantum nelumboides]
MPWGCFCFTVLPFGLTNGPAHYQKSTNWALSPFIGNYVQDFIDDFCVYSTRAEHCEKLEMVLRRYDECGGQLNPKKCFFVQPRVKLLDHMVSENGIEADPDKVMAIMLLPTPQTTKQLAAFIHKVKYMACFIPLSLQILYPLQQVAKNDPLQWDDKCEEVFQCVKEILGGLPAMQAPDWEQVFYVNSSMGEDAIGAMLLQKGKESQYMRPIYCASRVKTVAERTLSEVELLINGVNMSKAVQKWVIELQEFEFTFLVEESTRATLANLLTYKDSPVLVKEETVKKVVESVPEISNAHLLFFDGSYRKSHDAASGGIALYDPQGKLVCKKGFKMDLIGECSEARQPSSQEALQEFLQKTQVEHLYFEIANIFREDLPIKEAVISEVGVLDVHLQEYENVTLVGYFLEANMDLIGECSEARQPSSQEALQEFLQKTQVEHLYFEIANIFREDLPIKEAVISEVGVLDVHLQEYENVTLVGYFLEANMDLIGECSEARQPSSQEALQEFLQKTQVEHLYFEIANIFREDLPIKEAVISEVGVLDVHLQEYENVTLVGYFLEANMDLIGECSKARQPSSQEALQEFLQKTQVEHLYSEIANIFREDLPIKEAVISEGGFLVNFWLETAELFFDSSSGPVSSSGYCSSSGSGLLVTGQTGLVSSSGSGSGLWFSSSGSGLCQVLVFETEHEHIESASINTGTYYPPTLGFGPLAETQGSATQDPHIVVSDSSSDFDVMEGYPMQQHLESSSQDMHALGQQPGISMFSRLKETLSRATRLEHATNEINEGSGEVDSPFTSQIDPILSESVHVSTPATTPIGLSKLTPSETLLPDGRSLAEVQEVEHYILAAREKEIESLRKVEQR